MAHEIIQRLAQDMEGVQSINGSAPLRISDLLIPQLAHEVVRQLKGNRLNEGSPDEELYARLEKAERKLEKLALGVRGNDEDEIAGTGSSFPNLKYARPKYKNVESILKYVERDEDKGGVKLVIMNFND